MNIERMVMGIGRRILMRLVYRGVDAGIDRVAGGRKAPDERTPEERAQERRFKQAGKRAKQGARLARRLGRF